MTEREEIKREIVLNNMIKTTRLVFWLNLSMILYLLVYIGINALGYVSLGGTLAVITMLTAPVPSVFALTHAACTKFRSPLSPYLLLGTMIWNLVIQHGLYPATASLLFTFPIFLATRYYSRKIISFSALLTLVLFLLSAFICWELQLVSEAFRALYELQFTSLSKTLWEECLYVIPTPLMFIILSYAVAVSMNINHGRVLKEHLNMLEDGSRIDAELGLASSIQTQELPAESFRTDDGALRISASVTPAKQVGGDFYDYFMTDDHTAVFLVADVSDKGVPAAMFMMSSKKVLNYALRQGLPLAEAAALANDMLTNGNDTAMFLTLWVGQLDLLRGELTYVNCGHPSPCLITRDGTLRMLTGVSGGAVGFFPGMEIVPYRETLSAGDSLLLYTDGVTDSRNTSGKRFEEDGVRRALSGGPASSGISLKDRLSEALKQHSAGAEQFDDITILEVDFSDVV